MNREPSVFMSHSHADKPFVRRLGGDLAALGAKVWIDEAELRIGDSLFAKIENAIDAADFLAIHLSPSSVDSRWVQEELRQALHGRLSGDKPSLLPILLRDCTVPGFLREKVYVDFRDESNYEQGLDRIAGTIGLMRSAVGARIRDPFAQQAGRIEVLYARPSEWFCGACGQKHNSTEHGAHCKRCQTVRPLFSQNDTVIQCPYCKQFNMAMSYCEWCGHDMMKEFARMRAEMQ
jgi:hypothetical protein